MAKKKRSRRKGFNTQSLMKYVRLAALAGPGIAVAMQNDTAQNKIRNGLLNYTGFDMYSGSFDAAALMRGWGPYAASVAVTYGIPKLAGILRGL